MAEVTKRINQVEPWLGEEGKRSVAEYPDSGGWLTEFRKTREFEKLIADHIGSGYASVVNYIKTGKASLT